MQVKINLRREMFLALCFELLYLYLDVSFVHNFQALALSKRHKVRISRFPLPLPADLYSYIKQFHSKAL